VLLLCVLFALCVEKPRRIATAIARARES